MSQSRRLPPQVTGSVASDGVAPRQPAGRWMGSQRRCLVNNIAGRPPAADMRRYWFHVDKTFDLYSPGKDNQFLKRLPGHTDVEGALSQSGPLLKRERSRRRDAVRIGPASKEFTPHSLS